MARIRGLNVVCACPPEHREEVAVRDGELLRDEEGFAVEKRVHVVEALGDARLRGRLHVVARAAIEERAEALVELGADEREPLLRARALEGAGLAREVLLRRLLGDPLHDRRPLREELARRQAQRRHVALRVDRREVVAARGRFCPEVHALEGEIEAGLAECEMRGERAGARRKIERVGHGRSLATERRGGGKGRGARGRRMHLLRPRALSPVRATCKNLWASQVSWQPSA